MRSPTVDVAPGTGLRRLSGADEPKRPAPKAPLPAPEVKRSKLPRAIGPTAGVIVGDKRYTGYDQPMVIYGATGAGKTSWLIRNIIRSPGPTIISSMKPELFAYTAGWFTESGRPVTVLDCDGDLDIPATMRLRWSPVASCITDELAKNLPDVVERVPSRAGGWVDTSQAEKIAGRLAYGAIPGSNADDGWRGQTEGVVTALLVAAAAGGISDIRQMIGWVESVNATREPLDILRMAGLSSFRSRLNGALGPASAHGGANRASFVNLVSRALDGLRNPYVVQMAMCTPATSFDVKRFIEERGVLYLLGSSDSQKVVATIVATMIEDVIERASKLAQPLRPPLTLWLDEAANTAPLPKMPELYSTARGMGVFPVTVFQSYAQEVGRWGEEGAATIGANAVVEIHLGGSKDQTMLGWLERAGGQSDVRTTSSSYGQGTHTRTVGQTRQARFDIAELRGLPPRHAWLVYSGAMPVETHLAPWWECSERPAVELALEQATAKWVDQAGTEHQWVPDKLMPRGAPPRQGALGRVVAGLFGK